MSNEASPSPAPAADDRKTRLRNALQEEFDRECQRQKVTPAGPAGAKQSEPAPNLPQTDASASAEQLERVWQALVNRLAMDIPLREKICAQPVPPKPTATDPALPVEPRPQTQTLVQVIGQGIGRLVFRKFAAAGLAPQNFTLEHGGWINEWLDEMAQEIAKKFPVSKPKAAETKPEDPELHRLRRRLLDVRVGPSTFIKNARDFRAGHALTPLERTSEEINLHQPQVQKVFLIPPPGYGERRYALDDYCRAVADGTADDGVLVVTGVRGSGKSTLLNRVEMFCNHWQLGEHRPFYLRFDLGCHFGPRFLLNLLEALARSAYEHCRRPPFGRAGESAPRPKGGLASLLSGLTRSYVGVVGRSGRWCSGNLRWALLMLMVGWLAVAALLLSQRPAPSVIQGQALFRSLEAHEKAFNDTKTNQAETLGLMTDLFQILDDHEQKFRKGDWLVTGASLSTNASFLSGFQPTIDLLTTNVSTNGWPPVFSNGWNFFVFNPTSAVPVRWVTNFIATNMLSALKKDGTNKVFSNNLVRARGSLAVEIRRLQSALQPIMPTPDNGVLPTLSSDEQGKYYVGTFALMAILALSASHNFYRRALVRELKPGGWAQQHSSVLLWVMFVVGLGVLVVSLWAFSACQDRCARNAYPFFVMGGIMLVGVLGAYLFSWNHQLAPRDAIRAGTDWPRMRDAMMLLCLGCFFSALILTFCIWHSHPVLRTCGTLTVGGSLAVVALCLAQPWLPAWWDFKFRCYDLLLQLAQRAQKEPADLALVGQLAALAKMFLPVGVAGPDYQAMETPFLEQELKRLLHDCRVHFGRVIVLIDDVDVLPGEKHPELLRILRPVSKVRGATFLIAAPLHFFHLYRYASLNDVQSTVQNVIVMGDPKLFRGAEGKEEPFSLKIEALKESLEQLLAANMRIPCSSGTLPGFVKNLAACWVSGENKKRVDDELERCGASKRELLRELDRMLSIPGRQPFADRASTEDQKKWVAKAKADFSAAEREANPDFRREE